MTEQRLKNQVVKKIFLRFGIKNSKCLTTTQFMKILSLYKTLITKLRNNLCKWVLHFYEGPLYNY